MLEIAIGIATTIDNFDGTPGPPPTPPFSDTKWQDLIITDWQDILTDTWNT